MIACHHMGNEPFITRADLEGLHWAQAPPPPPKIISNTIFYYNIV